MKKFQVLLLTTIIFLTAILLYLTNKTFWLERIPVGIKVNIKGKGNINSTAYLDDKYTKKEINLNENNISEWKIRKVDNFKNLKLIFNIEKENTPQLKISNISLRTGKIKLDDLNKFDVEGADKKIINDELLLTPINDEIILNYPIESRASIKFNLFCFILILMVPAVALYPLFNEDKFNLFIEKLKNLKSNITIKNFIPSLIAILIFAIQNLLNIDKFFFSDEINHSNMIAIKILYLIFSIVIWYFIFYVIKKLKQKDKLFKRGVFLFCIYFSLMMILILILWPGTYNDDVMMLFYDYHYDYLAWQHVLTSIEHLLFLQILPFPAGVLIIRNLFISACVAFIIVKLENCYNLNLKYPLLDIIIKLSPFLLPPMLRYQFSGYRIGLLNYLEITAIVMLLCAIKCKEKWNLGYFTFFVTLSAIVINWRSENLFYLPVFLILCLVLKTLGSNKIRIYFSLFLIFSTYGIGNFQNSLVNHSSYELVSILNPLVEIVKVMDKGKYRSQFDAVNRVINVDMIYEYPDMDGVGLLWKKDSKLIRDHSKKEYKNLVNNYLYLSMKYPKIFFGKQIATYNKAVNNGCLWECNGKLANFFIDKSDDESKILFKSSRWLFNKPILPKLRYKLLNSADIKYIYNCSVAMIFLIIFSLFLLLNKKYKEFLLSSAILIKIPIIFITEPGGWFMYWLSIYVIGYLIFFYCILYWLSRTKGLKNG